MLVGHWNDPKARLQQEPGDQRLEISLVILPQTCHIARDLTDRDNGHKNEDPKDKNFACETKDEAFQSSSYWGGGLGAETVQERVVLVVLETHDVTMPNQVPHDPCVEAWDDPYHGTGAVILRCNHLVFGKVPLRWTGTC